MSQCDFGTIHRPRFVAWAKPGQTWMAVGCGETREECERLLVGRLHAMVLPYGRQPPKEVPQCSRD